MSWCPPRPPRAGNTQSRSGSDAQPPRCTWSGADSTDRGRRTALLAGRSRTHGLSSVSWSPTRYGMPPHCPTGHSWCHGKGTTARCSYRSATEAAPAPPHPAPTPRASGGRGLAIVSALTSQWWVTEHTDGTHHPRGTAPPIAAPNHTHPRRDGGSELTLSAQCRTAANSGAGRDISPDEREGYFSGRHRGHGHSSVGS